MTTSLIESNNSIEKGNKLINDNEFFNDLTKLMENEEFKSFFSKYFTNWTEIKSNVIFMNLYQEIKNKYKEINQQELDKSVVIFLIWKMMRSNNIRPFIIRTMDEQLKNNKLKDDFFDKLKLVLEDKED